MPTVYLTREEAETLLACIKAELALLNISGKDYTGPLDRATVERLYELLEGAKEVAITTP